VNTVEYQQVVGRRTASERHHDLPQPDLYAPFSLDAPLPKLATAGPGGIGDQSRSSAANGLRLLLARAHSLSAMLGESHAPSIRSLRATTERVAALATAGEFEELTSALGGLLPGLEAAVRTVPKGGPG
jgi:hypothetical protein